MAVVIPIQLKIKTALDKIGSSNGTALNEVTAPLGMTNEEATQWHNERNTVFALLVAQQIEAYGKKETEKHKEALTKYFPKIAETKAGASYGIVRGNVSCNVEVRAGREMLDMALLTSAMAKEGFDLPVIERILTAGKKTTAPAKHFKPSIIQDQG
jgi:hypothetical protein